MNAIELIKEQLVTELSLQLNRNIRSVNYQSVAGGSINAVYRLTVDRDLVFCCKINSATRYPEMFEAEAAGLSLIQSAKVIRVPGVLLTTQIYEWQVLVMEWIETATSKPVFWKNFGQQLSLLHSQQAPRYGLNRNNYMGALSQSNTYGTDWATFFYVERILPQVRIAVDKSLMTTHQAKQFENLSAVLPGLFPESKPMLVHGDLWSGNFLCDTTQQPVLIDPAVYYGHPAMDLAMTTLFGGFDPLFYDSYNYHNPFPDNHRVQWDCCNLYPLLIHLNLFGKSYLPTILDIIGRY